MSMASHCSYMIAVRTDVRAETASTARPVWAVRPLAGTVRKYLVAVL